MNYSLVVGATHFSGVTVGTGHWLRLLVVAVICMAVSALLGCIIGFICRERLLLATTLSAVSSAAFFVVLGWIAGHFSRRWVGTDVLYLLVPYVIVFALPAVLSSILCRIEIDSIPPTPITTP